jgi:RimJ/RimL family protein N-acetyltransferase
MSGEPVERIKLRDGRVVDVRPLERRDRRLLAAAIRRLSDESRYLRFGTPKPHIPDRALDRLVDVDHHDREALLAIDPVTGRGVAVARYVQVPGEPGVVELAATVADDWQGIGLGSALLARLTRRALDEGQSAFRAYVLAVNRRAIAMLRRAGFRARQGTGTLREYELRLDLPGLGGSVECVRRPATLEVGSQGLAERARTAAEVACGEGGVVRGGDDLRVVCERPGSRIGFLPEHVESCTGQPSLVERLE